ncbi:ACP S-malonyltransferase [Clostridium sp. BNL1100]|uniref:ACP S-malonyltransferase n=1 Tax=Clostridium sp. BNL1100 TaxID=755731 RepID=UPI00024A7D05|nr:ACP S-malonyltransferase [Clostridium sp. BNL1100]AEY67083.1 (acyl-carrier-protein) S-malonyltransferase [Clostridium sp. BNL1100]
MKKIFIFPGQGAQNPQMLQDIKGYSLNEIKPVFDTVSEACKFDVIAFLESATQEKLSLTNYTQIVMFAMNMAYVKVLSGLGIKPDVTAGHSLGQYCALVAAGVLDLYETSCLIRERSRLMSELKTDGRLCAVSSPCMSIEYVEQMCSDISKASNDCLQIALYNSNKQIVVGGAKPAIEKFYEEIKQNVEYKATILPVGQAFHTPIMDEMLPEFRNYVNDISVKEPSIPVILNCTGDYYIEKNNGEDLKNELIEQCHKPVRWLQTMNTLLEVENPVIIEVGPGHSLSGLFRNLTKEVKVWCSEDKKSLMTLSKKINQE